MFAKITASFMKGDEIMRNFFDKYGLIIILVGMFILLGFMSGLTGEIYGL